MLIATVCPECSADRTHELIRMDILTRPALPAEIQYRIKCVSCEWLWWVTRPVTQHEGDMP